MEKLIDLIKNSKRIAIFGAGTIADIFYWKVKSVGCEKSVGLFLVSEIGGNEVEKFGQKVIEINKVEQELNGYRVFIATQERFQKEITVNLEKIGVYDYFCVDANELTGDFFNQFYDAPVNRWKILGQNQKTAGYGDNPKYIFEELYRRYPNTNLDLVWSVSSYDEQIPDYVRQVIYGSYEYYKELATAGIWIDNARKPMLTRKRKGQVYIQTWHGAAPIKKVEADAANSLSESYFESAKHDSEMADLFISGSSFYSDLYRKSFWYQGEILEVGLPRQDVFWNRSQIRRKIIKKYCIREDEAIALYAPTFRKNYSKGCYGLHINNVSRALEKRFGKKFSFLVSRHPVNHIEYEFNEDDKFIEVDRSQDFEEILAAADVLITDYSGCMYDFSFSKRPVFLFQADYEEYLDERDFYVPMDKLPYIKAHSNEELIEKIEKFDSEEYSKGLENFMNSMGNFDKGDASEKVVDYIVSHYLKG